MEADTKAVWCTLPVSSLWLTLGPCWTFGPCFATRAVRAVEWTSEHLIAAIEGDIEYARMKFREPDIARLATEHPFWLEVSGDERAARTPSASTNAADASGSAASAAPSDKA